MKYYLLAFIFFVLLGAGLYFMVTDFVAENIVEPPSVEGAFVEQEEATTVISPAEDVWSDTTLIGNVDFDEGFIDTVNYEVIDGFSAINWKTLSRVKFKEEYVDSLEMLVPFPVFHPSVTKWDGQPIQIAGYVIPIEETGDSQLLVLSKNSFANCFFCGNAGPETVMDIKLKTPLDNRLKQDDKTTFQGRLKLNSTDLYYLNYILEEAELVE